MSASEKKQIPVISDVYLLFQLFRLSQLQAGDPSRQFALGSACGKAFAAQNLCAFCERLNASLSLAELTASGGEKGDDGLSG